MFQYISCYSLSASAERITVLYPKFQYISCYSLSRKGMGYGTSGMRVSIHLMLLFIWLCLYKVSCGLMFQYISCYSLSVMAGTQGTFRTSFNTSHVTLYPEAPWSGRSATSVSIHLMLLFIGRMNCLFWRYAGFNTSHVTLYRCKGPRKCPGSLVSIHLMLLFIYSRWSLMRTKWRFNTSHVTLYRTSIL